MMSSILPKNEQSWLSWVLKVLRIVSFVHFLEEYRMPQFAFKIYWPLHTSSCKRSLWMTLSWGRMRPPGPPPPLSFDISLFFHTTYAYKKMCLKVSKLRKQIVMSWILPKNERNWLSWAPSVLRIEEGCAPLPLSFDISLFFHALGLFSASFI